MYDSLTKILPDSFTSMIFALEALRGGTVLLNGPTGCKFYHAAVVGGVSMRSFSYDPLDYPSEFYFGQGQVPCTYLDSHDYVFGSKDKLSRLLEFVKQRSFDFVAVVNSPGAALIGDDLEALLRESQPASVMFALDTPGFSQTYGKGHQDALIALLEQLPLARKPERGYVNLLGFTLMDKYAHGNRREMIQLLKDGGVAVGSTLFDESIDQITNLSKAELNIVVSPENGLSLAKYLEKRLGIPYFIPTLGQPVGFPACERFFEELAEQIAFDLEPVIRSMNSARRRAYYFLSRYTSLLGMPKGAAYRLYGNYSLALPLLHFLTRYLGMIPVELVCSGVPAVTHQRQVEEFMKPFPRNENAEAEICFGDGNDVAASVLKKGYRCGIEIAEPSMGYLDVYEKTLFGPRGALFILEQVLNGLKFSR